MQNTEEQLIKVKLSEAQAQLLQKTRALESAAERTAKQESQTRREIKKMKKLHSEQCEELSEQIEMVGSNVVISHLDIFNATFFTPSSSNSLSKSTCPLVEKSGSIV